MKSFTICQRLRSAGFIAALIMGGNSFAQMPGGSSTEVNSTLSKLFGSNTAFTAKAEMHVLDKSQKETTLLPMGFAMLEGKIRMDMDMSRLKSAELPPTALAYLKQMKLDQIVTIARPDKKSNLTIYPLLQAYVEKPMSKDEAVAAEKIFRLDKTAQGRETIDGHACDKNKVVVTDDLGRQQTVTIWNAPDLNDFPVQIQLPAAEDTVIFKFKDVRLARPDAKQFEAPPGLKKYASDEALTQTVVAGQK